MASQDDINQVIAIILQMYSPEVSAQPLVQKEITFQLAQIDKKDEAWSLVGPMLMYPDVHVKFFGANTCSIKITRDLATLPLESIQTLLSSLIGWTIQLSQIPHGPEISQAVIRKLFVCITHLIIHLSPAEFPTPLKTITSQFNQGGVSTSNLLEFWKIFIEEINQYPFAGTKKKLLDISLREDSGAVVGFITSILTQSQDAKECTAAFQCLQAWIVWGLTADQLSPLLPIFFNLLSSPQSFIPAATTIEEVLTNSCLRDGKGIKILTEPLLQWLYTTGKGLAESAFTNGFQNGGEDDSYVALCKLLVALGEHSTEFIAKEIEREDVQNFISLMLGFTGLNGSFGDDEEISDVCLPFWSLLQEALTDSPHSSSPTGQSWGVAKSIFSELVKRLRAKVVFPQAADRDWMKDQLDRFMIYRNDVGDVLVTSFYILRDDMLQYLISQLLVELETASSSSYGWEDVEATLHCLRVTQEAVPHEEGTYLQQIFSPRVLDKLPTEGTHRVRLTAVSLVGEYAEWFKYHAPQVLPAIAFIVPALSDPFLSSAAAVGIKQICDICRLSLVPHINDFSALYVKVLGNIPVDEQGRVLQAICSVIEALPAEQAVEPIIAIINPVLESIAAAIQYSRISGSHMESSRLACIDQLGSLEAIAKGLTPQDDDIFDLDEEEDQLKKETNEAVRMDSRLVDIRDRMTASISSITELYSGDAMVADGLSRFLKAMTSSTTSPTLTSLSPVPLLTLVVGAGERSMNSIWLGLAETLVNRLAPPPSLLTVKHDGPVQGTNSVEFAVVKDAAHRLIAATSAIFGQDFTLHEMTERPDLVEYFFKFCATVTERFPTALVDYDIQVLDTAMNLALRALALQHRYSVQASIEFITSVIAKSREPAHLAQRINPIIVKYAPLVIYSIVSGVGRTSPRSLVPNLSSLLGTLILKFREKSAVWLAETLAQDGFPDPRSAAADKQKFKEAVLRASNIKLIREATNEFALISRGLSGTTYGNST